MVVSLVEWRRCDSGVVARVIWMRGVEEVCLDVTVKAEMSRRRYFTDREANSRLVWVMGDALAERMRDAGVSLARVCRCCMLRCICRASQIPVSALPRGVK